VTYRGAGTGRVVVGVTAGVLPEVAGNMLGAAAAPDAQLQRDALGEIGNVVTGNVLPLVYGAAPVFRLDAPREAGAEPFASRDGEALLALARLTMDEGDTVVALFAEPDAAALLSPHAVAAGAA
jgi:CheY-specific phosphatase CheX